MINFKRLLNTQIGVVFISIILGLGLATMFRKACSGKNCIHFHGPKSTEIDGKVYQFGDDCYKYTLVSAKCDSTKKIIDFKSDNKKKEEQFSQEDISAAYETHGKISENEKNGKSEDSLGWFDKISDFFS
jgi:hypothetical protein